MDYQQELKKLQEGSTKNYCVVCKKEIKRVTKKVNSKRFCSVKCARVVYYIKYIKNNPIQVQRKKDRLKLYQKTEKSRDYYRKRMRRLRKEDEQYQIHFRIYNQFRKAYKKYNEGKLISPKGLIDFKLILKSLGDCPGKRTDWHIDHIRPISSFDLTKEEEILKAWNPENLRWLPAKENLLKSNKIMLIKLQEVKQNV
ncbi:MAG TPA: HNH endonuclease signature motif containing protein [Candidatus Paceibacterota bacterium]|nr:HNH endonuclease signature motif containing protein [Candidatus Paceibacterota bacterium]